MTEQTEQSITIDGKSYEIASLSDEARQQIVNIRAVDQELERLKRQIAITQMARKGYSEALVQLLPGKS